MMTEKAKDKYFELGAARAYQDISVDILNDACNEWKRGNFDKANTLRTVSDKIKACGERLREIWDDKYPKEIKK